MIDVAGKKVMLSRRFDRDGTVRIPFLSAMAMMGAKDGERGNYPEIVDALAEHDAQGKNDAHALYRRVVFNVRSPTSTITCAITVFFGSKKPDGRYPPPIASIRFQSTSRRGC